MTLRLLREKNLALGLHDLMKYVGPVNSLIEIGVFSGESTLIFSKYVKRIYAIDPWLSGYDDENDVTSKEDMNLAWRTMVDRAYECIVLPIRAFSPDIAPSLPNVDMVYIDGCHQYTYVKNDLLAWKNKCRIIAGHDYTCKNHTGVKKAVDEVIGTPDKTFRDSSWVKIQQPKEQK